MKNGTYGYMKSETYKGYFITFEEDYDSIKLKIFDDKPNYSHYNKVPIFFKRVGTKKEGFDLAKKIINKRSKK